MDEVSIGPHKSLNTLPSTSEDWSWVVHSMGLCVCFPFWQAEQSPILPLSTTIPSVRFDLAILWTVSSLTCPSLQCHNAREAFDVIWLWVMCACPDLIISTLSLYRFLSWLTWATIFPEVV